MQAPVARNVLKKKETKHFLVLILGPRLAGVVVGSMTAADGDVKDY